MRFQLLSLWKEKKLVVNYKRKVLENGLRVLIHEDQNTPLAAVNVLYNVGSKDEEVDKTGFAHLFEHLMFGGSKNVPDFDEQVQQAGGDSNAFTNSDLTNFYDVLPVENIETALWLESDRMLQPNLSQKALTVQQKVVIEEFKETCLNEPYGEVWHHMTKLAYKVHPYKWPTIGLDMDHIAEAKLEEVHAFFQKHYCPNNAVLTIAGPITAEEGFRLAEKWFGEIPARNVSKKTLPSEPRQNQSGFIKVEQEVPVEAIYMGFHIPGRMDPDYYAYDLLSDVLGNGPSSRLYRRLLKEQSIFSSLDAYITGTFDPGLLVIDGKISKLAKREQAKAAIWKEIDDIKQNGIPERELLKFKNKAESNIIFSEMSTLNKAINLAQYELLGDADLINTEVEEYRKITVEQVKAAANECFREENCSEVYYPGREG